MIRVRRKVSFSSYCIFISINPDNLLIVLIVKSLQAYPLRNRHIQRILKRLPRILPPHTLLPGEILIHRLNNDGIRGLRIRKASGILVPRALGHGRLPDATVRSVAASTL